MPVKRSWKKALFSFDDKPKEDDHPLKENNLLIEKLGQALEQVLEDNKTLKESNSLLLNKYESMVKQQNLIISLIQQQQSMQSDLIDLTKTIQQQPLMIKSPEEINSSLNINKEEKVKENIEESVYFIDFTKNTEKVKQRINIENETTKNTSDNIEKASALLKNLRKNKN